MSDEKQGNIDDVFPIGISGELARDVEQIMHSLNPSAYMRARNDLLIEAAYARERMISLETDTEVDMFPDRFYPQA